MEILTFLLWPFLACLLLVLIHAWFGIHILERGIIFVDLALAQFIGIGIALNLLLGREGSYLLPLLFAFTGALILATARRLAGLVNIEAFIGVLYIFSLSTSILILDKAPHGLEEFKTIMNGNILWVTPHDLGYRRGLRNRRAGPFPAQKEIPCPDLAGEGGLGWSCFSSAPLPWSWSNRCNWPGFSRSSPFWWCLQW